MWVNDLVAEKKFYFVTGKGGVGKTSLSAALAVCLNGQNKRTLIVSTDPAHSLSDCFGVKIGDKEKKLSEGLFAFEIDPVQCAERYVEKVKERMRLLVSPELYPQIDSQMSLAKRLPGVMEAALVLKIADLLQNDSFEYDRIVFDTAPTGHTLQLLRMPELMSAWTSGLMSHQNRSARLRDAAQKMWGLGSDLRSEDSLSKFLYQRHKTLKDFNTTIVDTSLTAMLLTVSPEELAILEAKKAWECLKDLGIICAGIFINRILPECNRDEFWIRRKELESIYLEKIHLSFPNLKKLCFPLMDRNVKGIDTLRVLWASGY